MARNKTENHKDITPSIWKAPKVFASVLFWNWGLSFWFPSTWVSPNIPLLLQL